MGGLTSWLRQVVAVSLMNLSSIRQRIGSSLVTVVGVAGVVMVFIGVLSVAQGFRRTLETTGDPENVLIMRSGSDSEMVSAINLDETRIISDAPGLARTGSRAAASSELFVIIDLPRISSDSPANVPLRGLDPATAFDVRGNVEITAGRAFEAGKNEVIVGEAAASQFAGLQIGDRLEVGEAPGRWWGTSAPAARWRSRKSGATPGSCSLPIAAATSSRPCTLAWKTPKPSPTSRTP